MFCLRKQHKLENIIILLIILKMACVSIQFLFLNYPIYILTLTNYFKHFTGYLSIYTPTFLPRIIGTAMYNRPGVASLIVCPTTRIDPSLLPKSRVLARIESERHLVQPEAPKSNILPVIYQLVTGNLSIVNGIL